MQKITPNLWFESEAEDAANFYTSVFKNSKILNISRYGEGAPQPPGTVLTVEFELEGVRFTALNGGPADFKFDESISFLVDCKSQEEVDELWQKLTEGGEPGPCGWLKDKYGVSWQIVPSRLVELLQDEDAEKAKRVMDAMLKMGKIEIADLEKAYSQ